MASRTALLWGVPALCAGAAIVLSAPVHAAVTGEAAGYVELRFMAQPGVTGRWWTFHERLRPRFEASLHDRVRLVAEVDLHLRQGRSVQRAFEDLVETSDLAPLLELASCQWPREANERLQISDVADLLSVDRLYLDLYLPGIDIRIGRQPLFWGSAALLNPTDPFPELLVTEPWRPRRGTNAIRATVPLDADSDLTAVLATSDLFEHVRAAGRWRFRAGPTDLAFVGAYRGDDHDGLVGFDLRGDFGIGWWVEAALHLGGPVREELAVGFDYSFPVLDGLIVMGQYYRNGRGGGGGRGPVGSVTPPTCDVPETGAAAASPLTSLFPAGEPSTFAPVLAGKNYLMFGVTEVFARELSLSLTLLQNLDDGSGLFVPTLTARPWGFFEIAASAQITYAATDGGGEFRPSDTTLVQHFDLGPLLGERTLDLRGLLPDATVNLWTRFSF